MIQLTIIHAVDVITVVSSDVSDNCLIFLLHILYYRSAGRTDN